MKNSSSYPQAGAAMEPRRRKSRESGSTLVATIALVIVITSATGVAYMATAHLGRNAQRTREYESAVAVGDAHLEWAFAQWRSICRGQSNTVLTGSNFSAITAPTAAVLPQPAGFTTANYGVVATDAQGNTLAPSATPPPARGQNTADNSYYYKASVDVTVPTVGQSPVKVKVRRVMEKRIESPWEYAIFYNDSLEIHPSPKFTVNGWVHSNGDLYASPDGGNPLIFTDKVTYSGTYKEGYMDGDWQARGLPSAAGKAPGNTFATNLPPANDIRKDFAGIPSTQFNTADTNPNNNSYRELIEAPVAGYTDPLTDANGNNPRLYNAAGVKVTVDATNKITVMNGVGKVMTAASPIPAEKLFYNTVAAALTTNKSIQDYREASSVRLVTLDVGKLNTANIAGWNGVVYVSDTSADQSGGTPKRGVRLADGATLPAGGLTVVSDNPVYIQGDYNTLGTRKPAAVMGDAIMILSNSWSDANSSADISTRTATDTTVNTALLGGIVQTDPSIPGSTAYSGGVENFPRFMENWSGKTFTYNGSMVELFTSKQAVGRWGTSGQSYNPPVRNWSFETLFRTSPPPGTLFTTTYNKQRWFIE